jgi:hypothetical protein
MPHQARQPARHIFRWDLDKTYLRTEFDTFRDLLKSAFEKPADKRAVPGAPALLKALRAAGGPAHRICILSGSPQQMRRVLEAKLALDGVEYDEFILKPNLENLLHGRFRALRQQVPYKLPALLESRLGQGAHAPETLFGDDAESDAIIYRLYADLLAGRVPRHILERVLDAAGAYEDQRRRTLELFDELVEIDGDGEVAAPREEPVRRIVIHLDRRTPTARFDRLGPLVVPVFNYFQAALVLFDDGQLQAADVVGVAHEMLATGDYTLDTLANSLQELLRRGRIDRDRAARLALEAQAVVDTRRAEWKVLPPTEEIAWAFAGRVRALGEHAIAKPPPEPGRIDYERIVAEEVEHRRAPRHSRRD